MDKEELLRLCDKLLWSVIFVSGICATISIFYINIYVIFVCCFFNIILIFSYFQIRSKADLIVLGTQIKSGLGSLTNMLDKYG